MLLQELFQNENLESAYLVEINDESSSIDFASPPAGLKEIGFVMKIDNDGMMNESLMDIVISYRLSNVDIVIEVPSDMISSGNLDVKYLFNLSQNVDFAISLLPSDDIKKYEDVIEKSLEELLARPNFDKFVYPISNFLEYLMLEQVLGTEALADFRPEQRYLIENYSSVMTKEDSDRFKSVIRTSLYNYYGSKEDFELVAKTMLETVINKSEKTYTGFIQDYIDQNKQQS